VVNLFSLLGMGSNYQMPLPPLRRGPVRDHRLAWGPSAVSVPAPAGGDRPAPARPACPQRLCVTAVHLIWTPTPRRRWTWTPSL